MALLAIAIGLAVVVAGLAVVLRATAIRPVHVLAAEARRVADGDFGHEVAADRAAGDHAAWPPT